MKTLFDIGDKISVRLNGEVIAYSASKNGDCYTIEMADSKDQHLRVYLSGNDLKAATVWEMRSNNSPEVEWPASTWKTNE